MTATVAPGDSRDAHRPRSPSPRPAVLARSGVPAFHAATLGSATVAADNHGRVHLKVACPAGGAACAGTVTLTLPATASGLAVAARSQGTPVTVAAGDASFSAGGWGLDDGERRVARPGAAAAEAPPPPARLWSPLESHNATGQSVITQRQGASRCVR